MEISDKILDPYKIVIDEYNHTLIRKRKAKDGHEVEDIIGYFSSVGSAVKRIVKEEHPKGAKLVSLNQLIKYNTSFANQFLTLLDKRIDSLVIKKEKIIITKTVK